MRKATFLAKIFEFGGELQLTALTQRKHDVQTYRFFSPCVGIAIKYLNGSTSV
jgi:hypothetical protein